MGRTLSFSPGAVAQLGERRLCTAEVRGSNPLGSTLKIADLQEKREGYRKAPETLRGDLLQPYCNALPQRVLQGESCTILHVRKNVRVGVHHDFGVDVLREQQCRTRVPHRSWNLISGSFANPRAATASLR